MHKIFLCLSLLVNSVDVNEQSVERIEYSSVESETGYVNLEIDLYSSLPDVIEMQIYFYNG